MNKLLLFLIAFLFAFQSLQANLNPCLPVTTFPYTENFDTYGLATGVFPQCWFRPVLSGATPYPSIKTNYFVSPPASLKFQSASASNPTYAITPEMGVDINTLRVLFKLKAESLTYSGTIQVGVMSDPLVPSTFELVQIITPTSTAFTDYDSTGTNAYPTCWSKLSTNATYPYIATTNFSIPGSLNLYSNHSGGYCHAVSPMFDSNIPINTLKAEFKLRVQLLMIHYL